VAALRILSGAPAAALLPLISVIAAFGFILLLCQVSRGLGRPRRESIVAALVVMFAMGGLGWIFLPLKIATAFTGADRGMEALKSVFDLWPPRISYSLGFLSLLKDQPFLPKKFLVGTAMSLALAAVILHLEASRRVLFREGGVGPALIVAVSAFGAIVLHPVMGVPAVAVLCGLAFIFMLRGSRNPFGEEAASPKAAALLLAANICGVILSMPYLLLVTAGKEGSPGLPLSFLPIKIISMIVGCVGVLLPAAILIGKTLRRVRAVTRGEAFALGWAALMVAFAVFVRFPLEHRNIDKPLLIFHLPLALWGGWALGRALEASGRPRRRARWYLGLLLVPANLIIFPAYFLEQDPRTYRPHEKEAFAAIDSMAPEDAIVFDSQDRDRPGVEIQRRQYWGYEQIATDHEYPRDEMDARRSVRDALYTP
jgi:hypothetical protein